MSFWNISRNNMQINENTKQFLDFRYNILMNMENIELLNHSMDISGFLFWVYIFKQ